jgi:ubiquinone/menaquinone biosynthesis C-methylase UbiE
LEGGDKLLDFGCGSGSLVLKAKAQFKEVHGVDISPSRIKAAEALAAEQIGDHGGVYFYTENVNSKVAFPDSMFDAVTSVAVIEHIFDPYFAVGQIYRVLKPGGVFIIDVPNIAYLKYRIQLLCGSLPVTSSPDNWKEIGWDGGHLHYFTQKMLCKLLQECGFKIARVTGCGLFGSLRNFYPALLTGDICVKAIKE